jgi:hypothetical protein
MGFNGKQNFSNNGEKKEYLPLPPGEYAVVLNRVVEKTTKAGNGSYLETSYKVTEGDHKNRLIFGRFMLDHPSSKTVEIGRDQLNSFLKAAGIAGGLSDIEEDTSADRIGGFKDMPVIAKVAIEQGTNGYKDKNKITSFKVR